MRWRILQSKSTAGGNTILESAVHLLTRAIVAAAPGLRHTVECEYIPSTDLDEEGYWKTVANTYELVLRESDMEPKFNVGDMFIHGGEAKSVARIFLTDKSAFHRFTNERHVYPESYVVENFVKVNKAI